LCNRRARELKNGQKPPVKVRLSRADYETMCTPSQLTVVPRSDRSGDSNPNGRPAPLWFLRSPKGSISICVLAELPSGALEVRILTDGMRLASEEFETPAAALGWALSAEDRLVADGWHSLEAVQ
jgi:hypothetical protein